MRRLCSMVAVAALVSLPAVSEAQVPEQGTFVVDGGLVIDMVEPRAPQSLSLLIRDGVIEAVGPHGAIDVPPGATRIDATGRYLMPGLVDAHVHLFDTHDLPLLLSYGITSVLNMSGSLLQIGWADDIRNGARVGPALYTTGPQLKVEEQLLVDFERLVASPEAARRLVQYQAEAGYDFIKVWGPVDGEIHQAILEEAAAAGVRVTGHIPRAVGLDPVLAAGQSIGHIEEFTNKVLIDPSDQAAVEQMARSVAEAGTDVVTTLVTYEAIAASAAADLQPLLDRPERAELDPVRQLLWEADFNRYRTPGRAGRDGEYLRRLTQMQGIARTLHEAGVPLVAGSDAGEIPGLVPGADLHRELELLEEAGLERFAVLETATKNAGAFLDPDAPHGTIEVGRRADLLLLEANPLDDLSALRRPVGVMAAGRWYPRASIEAELGVARAGHPSTARFMQSLFTQGIDSALGELGSDRLPLTPGLFLSFALAESGDFEGTLRLLQAMSEAYPGEYMPRYMLGVGLILAGETEAGRAALAEVVRLAPGHDQALAILERTGGR